MSTEKAPKNPKRIIALICVILIILLVIATLLTAIFDSSGIWFRSCLLLTIAMPILAWVWIWLIGVTTKHKSMASFKLLDTDHKDLP